MDKLGFDPLKILASCKKHMNALSPEPEGGWAEYVLSGLIGQCFPRGDAAGFSGPAGEAAEYYLNALSAARINDRAARLFCLETDIDLLEKDEYENSRIAPEYAKMTSAFTHMHIFELLLLSARLRPFNTLSHIALVHFTALSVAKRAEAAGVPVDAALVSAAAATHDVGKFGCHGEEALRVPYLHYYYTDTFLRANGMPKIAHIASNHSTWDLEIENLSAESLILIYADFRAKSVMEGGVEKARLYSLKDAYNVILNKLDNVDDQKRLRYERVYKKLSDFEEYLLSRGVNVDPFSDEVIPVSERDPALLTDGEAARAIRLLTVDHNIRIMHALGSEHTFSALLEKMRSPDTKYDLRAFLSVLEEYHTYTSRQQKLMMLRFLYELLMHREGDVRRDAARLMGRVLAGGGTSYKKELPESAPIDAYAPALEEAIESRARLFETYLDLLLHPDHRIFKKHKARVMHSLKTVVSEAMAIGLPTEAARLYEQVYARLDDPDEDVLFVVLDTLESVPFARIPETLCKATLARLKPLCKSENRAIAVAAGRAAAAAGQKAQKIPETKDFSERYLENLKVATPWIVKVDNIDALTLLANAEPAQAFHVAAHLSNLLRVSEYLPVREHAGDALLAIAKNLSPDQCNEIVVDLWRGLETAQYEFSRYIPPYLGRLALLLPPRELAETIDDLERQFRSFSERIASVSLATLGVIYAYGTDSRYDERLLGLVMTGLAHESSHVRQEARRVLSRMLFAAEHVPAERKKNAFCTIVKKLLTLIRERRDDDLLLFSTAAMLNHIYRFTTGWLVENGPFEFPEPTDIAFFPGSFDPFSLGHKGIVDAIRARGIEVYLSIDEFSWSKRTQPKLARRRIAEMTVADRFGVYLFPDAIPVNLANPADLERLAAAFPGRKVYIVAGSDVIENASAYRAKPAKGSVHAFPHIVFARNAGDSPASYKNVTGPVTELSLPIYLEDVSSTRICESIDKNLDISALIDPVAQRYIYERGLYLRTPQYKSVLLPRAVNFHRFTATNTALLKQVFSMTPGLDPKAFSAQVTRHGENAVALYRDATELPCGAAFFHYITAADFLSELGSFCLAEFARKHTSGRIVMLDGVFTEPDSKESRYRLILTEALSAAAADDCAYAFCRSYGIEKLRLALLAHGFLPVPDEDELYFVDMRFPIALINDTKERLKEPHRSNARIVTAIERGSANLQNALTKLYPGELVLSYDSDVLYRQLIRRVTTANHVPFTPETPRRLGEAMCVPYGKILSDVVVPNTVTKTLHADKRYSDDLQSFEITEYAGYSTLENQVRAIRSFNREVLLVDDLLHNGHRMHMLAPLFEKADIPVRRIIVGILSGRGRDLMAMQGRSADSVYFLPNLRHWFSDSLLYPFIGGDSVHSAQTSSNLLPSINLIYPYAAPFFIKGAAKDSLLALSLTALENAYDILLALENEHAYLFERSLTVGRLAEAVEWPRIPDRGRSLRYDESAPASEYVRQDIETLHRMEPGLK